MKTVSIILQKKTKRTFWPAQCLVQARNIFLKDLGAIALKSNSPKK